ncbi:MAG: Ppx/GppA family phosphatase [Thaumarchaeota archaeon]|nr:Ppx/GppA family phosphatase [Nitrososphaerota archaeon]
MKISVIDLGYNSAKLVTYNVKDDDSFDVFQQEGIKVKLGEGLDEKGKLGKKPMLRTIDTLKLFRDMIQSQPIKSVLPIATSAVREANNREEFLAEVYRETGFRFKVLSEKEEALYSYVGAIRSLQIPDALFFDIGGGSLEIVNAEGFKIRKVISLPLGALRLTQQFNGENKRFSEKNYKTMRRFISSLLPEKKEMGLGKDTKLVGVGGVLRALVRYEQKVSKYPLDKIHNYRMNFGFVKFAAKQLYKMKYEDVTKISVIGSSRAETIVAGSCVIDTLMENFGFDSLCISNHGVREGALSVFLENPKAYHSENITAEQIRQTIGSKINFQSFQHTKSFVESLVSSKLLNKREVEILSYVEKKISEKLSFNNPQSLFYSIMDEDMSLSHTNQLILGLVLVHTRHVKTSDWLFARYKSILSQQDKSTIRKISSLITLLQVLEQAKSKIELKRYTDGIIELHIMQAKLLPKLLRNALNKFENAFDIHVICMLRDQNMQSSVLEL